MGYIFATKAYINNRKKIVKQQYLLHTVRPHNLASLLQGHRSTEVNQTLHDVWPSPWLRNCRPIYILVGCCPVMEFFQLQNSLCVQVLRSAILAALLYSNRAVGVSQSLQRGTRNGITNFAEGATYIWQGGHHVGHRPTF